MHRNQRTPIGFRKNGCPIYLAMGGEETISLSDQMRGKRATAKAKLDAINNAVEARDNKTYTADEDAAFDAALKEIGVIDARIGELVEAEKREAAANAHVVETQTQETRAKGGAQVTDPEVYAKGNHAKSYFRDLAKAKLRDDRDAGDQLRRHAAQMADKESRALGNTNTTGGSGGEFAPPEWLVNDFIALVRPGRATAQLYTSSPVPQGVSSVNLPKILSGTTVALQTTQNTALSQTDLTTGSVGTGFSTIGGKEVVSQQLLDQSEIAFDQVITQDLAAAWSLNFGQQIINGAGTGANNNSVVNGLLNATVLSANQMTFTSGAPTAQLFYSKAAGMLSAFATARYAEPNVWLMHPRRWYWLLAQSDSSGRPLVVPDAMLASTSIRATSPIAANTGDPAQVVGTAGMFLGLPVVIDPLLPTTLGAGSNQDEVFLLRSSDLWVFESAPRAEVFTATYADSLGVLFRLFSYVGTILNRQTASIATMNGTGLTTPSF